MDETRVRLFVVFLVFVFALAVVRSEGNRKLLGTIFRNRISWISQQEHDQETIEQIWFHCWNKIEHRAEAVQDFNIFLQHDAEKAITDLPPKEKRTLLDCLTRKNLLLDISSNEPPPSTWFRKFFESFLDWSNVPRRFLKSGRHHRRRHHHQHQHHHHKAQSLALASVPLEASLAFAPGPSFLKRPRSPSPAPGPALVPIQNSPAPSFLELSTAPSPISKAPTKAPEQSLPPNFDVPPLPIKHPPLQLTPHPSPNNKSDRQKYIIIASVASVVTVLALVALLFFCCLKRNSNKVGPKDGQRDDKPLLNFCLSNIPGSLEKSHAEENSRVNFLKISSFANNSSICSDDSSPGQAQSPEGNGVPAQTGIATLPVPPGRKAPPSVPPPPPPKPLAPSPPPPPKAIRPPPVPLAKPSPLRPRHRGRSSLGGDDTNGEPDSHKAKLKPFFWDKVLANPDDSMVWHELKAGSFQVNEEMIETLFGYTPAEKSKNEHRKGSSPFDSPPQYIKILDPKKSQNLAILLRALNVTTDEVCDALKEGNELPTELIQTLLKMAPTTEEELKLRLFNDDLSQLGPAERFLKALVEIPFAFKRLESLLFISSVQEEVSSIKESFQTLEVACTELKNSRLFLKLLEAVLKTGNRMNDGTFRGDAQAFKLDTLLKLSDVKGTDGKTTLLHFVVQEIIRSEGIRAARTLRESQSMSSMKSEELNNDSTPESAEYYRSLGLQVVSGLSCDLENVRKAAAIDGDSLATLVSKLGVSLGRIKAFFDNEMKSLEEESEFHNTLENFVEHTEDDIKWLVEEEKRIMALVKSTVDYFYRNSGKNEGLRLFVIVRDFLIILDKACKDVRNSEKMPVSSRPRVTLSPSTSSESCQSVEPDVRQRLFPAIRGLRRDDSSSDDESFSP